MKKTLEKIKKAHWLLLAIVALFILYFGFNFIKERIVANSFFHKYNVLTVLGDDIFNYKTITLNGKTIEKSNIGWTNVLPIPNTLKYLLMTSSYSEGHDIECGNTTIPKRVEVSNMGENEWCINNNGKELVSIASSQYYPYDENETVHEVCLKSGYYEGVNEGSGYNGCAEKGLFLNDKQIATTKETIGKNYITNKSRLEDASSFNYYPSKKLGNSIIYSTTEGAYAYDISSEKTTRLSDNSQEKIDDIFLTNDGKTILVQEASSLTQGALAFLGKIAYEGQSYTNVYSANYADGHFYMLRMADSRETGKGSSATKILTYELLRDGRKIENLETEGIAPYGYSPTAIQQFPLCETDTIVCIYENGHYAYQNRTLQPDVFGYDFYTEEMVIDGEWRGDNIPNLIGRSKPIFENNKLKYIVYAGFPDKGLYLIDFDKKWSFKDLYFKRGQSTTKLLSDYQNKLLNVMAK